MSTIQTVLRPYQLQGIERIYDAWKKDRGVLFQMPTGTGKTQLFAGIVRREYTEGRRCLIVAHRVELIEQIWSRLNNDFGVRAGIIMAGYSPEPDRLVQVASIQTLNRREYPDSAIVIIDEAHHATAATYRRLWNEYPAARFLGVTATPIRLSGEGFDDLFDTLIVSESIDSFIRKGYLAQIKYLGAPTIRPDVSQVRITEGDYDSRELSRVMRQDILMANLIRSYFDFARDKKMIVFAVDIEHSLDIVRRYQANGIAAEHIDAYSDKNSRAGIIEQFRTGEIKVLSNVAIVSEGFDVPDCDAVQLARPTMSVALFLQQVGRCTRPAPDKAYGLVLDNVGLYERFGSPRIERPWSLYGVPHSAETLESNLTGETHSSNPPLESERITLTVLEDVVTMTIEEMKRYIEKHSADIEALKHQIEKLKTLEGMELSIAAVETRIREKENENVGLQEQLKQALRREQGPRLSQKAAELQDLIDVFISEDTWELDDDRKQFLEQVRLEKIDERVIVKLGTISIPPPTLRTNLMRGASMKATSTKSSQDDFKYPRPVDYLRSVKHSSLEKAISIIGATDNWSDLCDALSIEWRGNSARRAFDSWATRRGLPTVLSRR